MKKKLFLSAKKDEKLQYSYYYYLIHAKIDASTIEKKKKVFTIHENRKMNRDKQWFNTLNMMRHEKQHAEIHITETRCKN